MSGRFTLLVAIALMALSVVYLRAEQTRSAAGALALEARWVKARRHLWSLQAQVARLRSPDHIHARMKWLDEELYRPDGRPQDGIGEHFALHQENE